MFRYFALLMIFTFLVVCASQLPQNKTAEVTDIASYENVTDLYKNILSGYDKRVRPRVKQTDFVTVTFLFRILGITEFDTARQKLSILGFFYLQWRDEMITWVPKSYGGQKAIKLPLKDIWYPAMKFIRDFKGSGTIGEPQESVIFAHTGDATWTPEGIFNVICDVNTRYYPFDRQSCIMSIYASDAATSEIHILPSGEGVALQGYQPNSEWKLINARAENISLSGTILNSIVIDLERRTEFLIYTIISPLVLLSVLNIGIFIVPIDSGEKGSIAVTLFLSYGIFVTAIKDELPHNSLDVSYFLIYIQILLMFSVFAVLYSFVESWIFSEHADNTVSRCCFANNKTENINLRNLEISASESWKTETNNELKKGFDNMASSMRASVDAQNESEMRSNVRGNVSKVTWRKLLRWIDFGLTLISVCAVSIATAVFFYFLSCRSNI